MTTAASFAKEARLYFMWAAIFFLIAIMAGAFGFTNIAAHASETGRVLLSLSDRLPADPFVGIVYLQQSEGGPSQVRLQQFEKLITWTRLNGSRLASVRRNDMSTPFNHCPEALVPIILDTLSAESIPVRDTPTPSQGIHEKTLDLNGSDFDELMVLYYHAFGSSFSCSDRHHGVTHNVSFVDKPCVITQQLTEDSRRYTVLIQLMKLPNLGTK